uniref:Uncharacterized protein n=1 Tax=uncultured bacterium lac111 TaxID=1447235 RepID=X2LC77_9BACT|nr:hypothetical protein [uncultured bacterium lac111]
MRSLLVLVLAVGCARIVSQPGDDEGSDGSNGSNGSATEKAEACGNERDCTADDTGCATYPYEQLPPRCQDICYRRYCCQYYEDAWHIVVYDCAYPWYDDGGIGYDAPIDGI